MSFLFEPGTRIVLREVFRGKVYSAKPMIVVRDDSDLIALYIPPGTLFKQPTTLDGSRVTPTAVANGSWKLSDAIWRGPNDSIRLVVPGESYSVIPSWDQRRKLRFWYINLEQPLCRTAFGFDFLDQILDIIVSPDMSTWRWKDEDELNEARTAGLVSDQDVCEIRGKGLRAVEFLKGRSSPFPVWEQWLPDPGWSTPTLPVDWDIINLTA